MTGVQKYCFSWAFSVSTRKANDFGIADVGVRLQAAHPKIYLFGQIFIAEFKSNECSIRECSIILPLLQYYVELHKANDKIRGI
jgi:hypothetical protein